MSKFILGKKVEMTQKFMENGDVAPVTIVNAGPCTVTQVKGDKEGYSAVQVGFGFRKKINKPLKGHLKKLENFRYLREFRLDKTDNFEVGKVFDVSTFEIGDILAVSAVSKGKGFQGVVKRHGFKGSPATHGHKDQHRMPGSIGATGPARVFKGTRMGGRMGTDMTTVANLEIIDIDKENNLLYIKGAVPGARNSLVSIVTEGDIVFTEKKEDIKVEDKKVDVKEEKVEESKKEEKKEEPKKEVKKEEDKK